MNPTTTYTLAGISVFIIIVLYVALKRALGTVRELKQRQLTCMIYLEREASQLNSLRRMTHSARIALEAYVLLKGKESEG